MSVWRPLGGDRAERESRSGKRGERGERGKGEGGERAERRERHRGGGGGLRFADHRAAGSRLWFFNFYYIRPRRAGMPRAKKPYTKDALPSLRGMRAARSASAAGGGNKSGEESNRWHEWRIYLNEDVFRGSNAPTRASLCARIRRAGARVETSYSVGVTHVVTAGGGTANSDSTADELDETSKILRGRSYDLLFCARCRRSKDLLLKHRRADVNPTCQQTATKTTATALVSHPVPRHPRHQACRQSCRCARFFCGLGGVRLLLGSLFQPCPPPPQLLVEPGCLCQGQRLMVLWVFGREPVQTPARQTVDPRTTTAATNTRTAATRQAIRRLDLAESFTLKGTHKRH